MPKINRYDRFDDIPLTPESWNALVDRSATNIVFLRYEWVSKWWDHFGRGFSLYFLTVEEDGQIIGFAPLMIDPMGHLRYLADTSADYLDFVIATDRNVAVDAILRYLASHTHDWRVLNLKNIPRDSGVLEMVIRSSHDNGLYPWHNYSIKAPCLRFGEAGIHAKNIITKSRMRRTMQRLAREGQLSMQVISDSDDSESFWSDYFAQHIERCASQGRKSPFLNADFCLFTKSLLRTDDRDHYPHLSTLVLDGKPIAFHFGFVSERRLLLYKPCFDISFSKFSPGIVLIGYLIGHALEHGLLELDFTIGEETYKSRFSNMVRDVDTVRVYNSKLSYLQDRQIDNFRQGSKHLIGKIRRLVRSG